MDLHNEAAFPGAGGQAEFVEAGKAESDDESESPDDAASSASDASTPSSDSN